MTWGRGNPRGCIFIGFRRPLVRYMCKALLHKWSWQRVVTLYDELLRLISRWSQYTRYYNQFRYIHMHTNQLIFNYANCVINITDNQKRHEISGGHSNSSILKTSVLLPISSTENRT